MEKLTYEEILKKVIKSVTEANRFVNLMADQTDPDYKKHIHVANGALYDAETALNKLHNGMPNKFLSRQFTEPQ